MVTCVPGHSVCTASASTCAASWRISSSARGSSRETNSILASFSIGSARSASRAVERHRDRALGERGRDALGDVETGDVVGVFAARAVGKGQRDHGTCSCGSLPRTSVGKRDSSVRYLAQAVCVLNLSVGGAAQRPHGSRGGPPARRFLGGQEGGAPKNPPRRRRRRPAGTGGGGAGGSKKNESENFSGPRFAVRFQLG